jgi:hypothetical protein
MSRMLFPSNHRNRNAANRDCTWGGRRRLPCTNSALWPRQRSFKINHLQARLFLAQVLLAALKEDSL